MTGSLQKLLDLQAALATEHKLAPGLFGEVARIEGLLADTYRDRVTYELLQNSDDAGSTLVQVHRLSDGRTRWTNNGRPLDIADIEALCRSASSTKARGNSIGYRGIGFKSLAAIADRIEIESAGLAFAFDRAHAAAVLGDPKVTVPLIRVPTDVHSTTRRAAGAHFTLTPRADVGLTDVDPLSTLFLRHVTCIESRQPSGSIETLRIERSPGRVVLHMSARGEAAFTVLSHGTACVAIPINARALALIGVRGRLACFLPLADEVGLPVIVSGDVLTDPSRTHAVLGSPSTDRVLSDAAEVLAEVLANPDDPSFNDLWSLVLQGEDMRGTIASGIPSVSGQILQGLRREMMRRRPPFAYSSLSMSADDVAAIFPFGAPIPLYAEENRAAARALKAVLGLETLDYSEVISRTNAARLSSDFRGRLSELLGELVRTHGRSLSEAEAALVRSATRFDSPAQERREDEAPATSRSAGSIATILARWRTAEVAVAEFLNGRGWSLRDVSTQNVGYDLDGLDPAGARVYVEVKKVGRLDERFAMTNNEISMMQSSPGCYLIAVVVGDGSQARLSLLDPGQDLPRERVCRRWDWEFADWSRFARELT